MHVGAERQRAHGAEGMHWAEEVAGDRGDRDLRHQDFLRGAEKLTDRAMPSTFWHGSGQGRRGKQDCCILSDPAEQVSPSRAPPKLPLSSIRCWVQESVGTSACEEMETLLLPHRHPLQGCV